MHEDHWTKRVVFVVRILFIRTRESVPLPVREKSVPECLFFFFNSVCQRIGRFDRDGSRLQFDVRAQASISHLRFRE